MAMFLQIVGAVALIGIALVVLVIASLWIKVRRAMKAIGLNDLKSFTQGSGSEPITLELEQIVGDVDWAQPEKMKALRDYLTSQGFKSLGVFQFEAMGDMQAEGWADAQRMITAVTYQHSALDKPWMDLVVREPGGRRAWTATNAPMGGAIETMPGKEKHYDANKTPSELMEHLETMVPAGLQREAPPENSTAFKQRLESAYAEEMEWRLCRGGPTEREVRAHMGADEGEADEDLFQKTHRALKTQNAVKLETLLLDRFGKETTMTVAEWREVESRLVFIHEHQTPERLNAIVEDWVGSDDVDPEGPFDEDETNFQPRAAFAAFNKKLEGEEGFIKVGEMSRPVRADVYKAPPPPDDDDDDE